MKSQKGFSLIEVMMAGVILVMAGMSAAGFAALMSKTNSTDQSKVDLLAVKSQMAQNLANERIWLATVGNSAFGGINNRLFRCFRLMPSDANHDCTQGEELQLFSPDTNAVLYDGRTASTQGFTAKGRPCNTFNPTTPDPNCPMKFNLSWSAICPVAVPNCAIPQVQINADFIYNNTVQSMSFINDSSSVERVSFASVVRIRDSANPVAVNDVVYTNLNMPTGAPVVFPLVDSQITFDPSVNDYTETGGPVYLTDVVGSVVVTATTKQATTSRGGIAVIDLTTRRITYTPAVTFYGVDSFQYQIQDAYGNTATGSVRVKVMTPYTWTGLAGNSNMTDLKNWCGKVVGGVCDGATSLIPLSASSIGDILHLVFDDTCDTTCAPLINTDIQIKSLEIRNFVGTVGFAAGGPYNLKLGWDLVSTAPSYTDGHQDVFGTKTFDGTIPGNPSIQTTAGSFIQSGGVFNGNGGGSMLVMGQLIVLNGNFNAPAVLEVQSHWRVFPTSFFHNNGKVILGTKGADAMAVNITCVNGQITPVVYGWGGADAWCITDPAWFAAGSISFNNLELRKESYGGSPVKSGMFIWPTDSSIVNDICYVRPHSFCGWISNTMVDNSKPQEGYFLKGSNSSTSVLGSLTLDSTNGCATIFGDLLVSGDVQALGKGCGKVSIIEEPGCPAAGCFADSNPIIGSYSTVFRTTQIKVVGTGIQRITSSTVDAKIPRLTMLSSGKIKLSSIVSVNGDYKALSGIVVPDVGSTLYYDSGLAEVGFNFSYSGPILTLPYFNPGNVIYENIEITSIGFELKKHLSVRQKVHLVSTCVGWCGGYYATALSAPEIITPGVTLTNAAVKAYGDVEMDGYPGDHSLSTYLSAGTVMMLSDKDATYTATKPHGWKTLIVNKLSPASIEFKSSNKYFPHQYYHIDGRIYQNPVTITSFSIASGDPQIINEYDSSKYRCFADLRLESTGGSFSYDVGFLGTQKACVNGTLDIGGQRPPDFAGDYNRFFFGVGVEVYGNLNFINYGISDSIVGGISMGSIFMVGGSNVTLSKADDTNVKSNANIDFQRKPTSTVTLQSDFTNSTQMTMTLNSGIVNLNGKKVYMADPMFGSYLWTQTGGQLNINGGVLRSDINITGGEIDIGGGAIEVNAKFPSLTGLLISNAKIVKNGGKLQLGFWSTNIFTGLPQRFPATGNYWYGESLCPAPPALPLVNGMTSGTPTDPNCVNWNPTAPTPEVPFDSF